MTRVAGTPAMPSVPATAFPLRPEGAVADRRARDEGAGRSGRLVSLDALRGLAILLVLGRHTVAPADGLGWFQPLARAWTHVGWSGVDLFFVLSGFLVSGLIFAEYQRRGSVDVRRFVIRRGFKIWPPYLAFVGFVALWLAWKEWRGAEAGVWTQIWPNLLHVQNYFHTPRLHTWSLAVEEHFYLAVAIGFWTLLHRGHVAAMLRVFPVFVAIVVTGLCAWRTIAYVREGPDAINIYATHLRFDGLLIGTLLAYWTHFAPEKLAPVARHPVALLVAGAALAAPVLVTSPEANAWSVGLGLTMLYLGYGALLLGWLHLDRTNAGKTFFASGLGRGLAGIGFFSYSIYLWHVDLAQTPMHKLALLAAARGVPPGIVWLVATALYVGLAIFTGRLLARLLEAPSLALRDRLFPSSVKPL